MEILNQGFKRNFNRKFRYVYLLAFVIFIVYMFFSTKNARKVVLNYKFNGVVEKVVYGEKSIPEVTINGVNYYLGSTSWNFNHLIIVGDSLQKDSGNITVKLIKQKTGRVLIFDGNNYYDK